MADLSTPLSTEQVVAGTPGHPARHTEDRDYIETLRRFVADGTGYVTPTDLSDPASAVRRAFWKRDGVNRVYVDPVTGDDADDGASTSSAKRTVPGAFAALKAIGPVLGGAWRITLAAGTYTAAAQLVGLLTPDDYLTVEGPEVSYGTPTAIIDPGAGATYGLWFGHGMRVRVRSVAVHNVTGSSVAAGIVLDQGVWGWMDNVHTFNTTWAGVNCNNDGRVIVQGGRYEANKAAGGFYGVRVYGGSTAFIGYNAATSARPLFINCVAGVGYQGSSYGHTDDCDFIGNDIDISTEFRSHSTDYNNSHSNYNVALQSSTFSSISSDNASTYTGGTTKSRHRSGWATGDDQAQHRTAMQYYDTFGSGRFAWGYPDWHTPWAKHQFTGDTQAGFNLSGFGAASMLLESGANTILALAAKATNYAAIQFGDDTGPNPFQLRWARSNGGADLLFDNASAYRFRATDIFPTVNDAKSLGRNTFRWLAVWAKTIRIGSAGDVAPSINAGTGSPEGVLSARVGSTYHREDGGAGTSFYVKESGTGNTGWVAK